MVVQYIYSKPYIPILLTVQNISMQTGIKRIVQLNKIAVDLCTEIKLIIYILLNLHDLWFIENYNYY